MLNVIKDMFHSEKGVFAYLLPLVFATVFVFTGKIAYDEWMEFALYLAGIYTGGKAIQGGASVIASSKSADAETMKDALTVFKSMLAENDAAVDAALEAKKEDESA